MKKILKDWVNENSISAIVITCLTIILSILLGEMQTKLGLPILILSIFIIFSVIVIVLWLTYRNVLHTNEKLAYEIKNETMNLIDKYKLGWLYSSQQLVALESSFTDIEIWLLTADLGEDKIGAFFQNCVSSNLKKGSVKYHYFLPNRLDMLTKVEQLKIYNQNSPNLSFTYLDDDFFFLVPKFDFSIYNPLNITANIERSAFMGIPANGEINQYHVKVSDEITDVLIGKLLKIIEI